MLVSECPLCTWRWVSVKCLPGPDSRPHKLRYVTSLYFAASRNNELESKSQLTIKVRNIRKVAKKNPEGGDRYFWDFNNLKIVP